MKHAKETDLNQVQVQRDAPIEVEVEEYDQTRVSLQFNKLALNVQEVEKKLPILAQIVAVKETNRLQKKYLYQFQKVLMMVQELD